MNANRFHVGCHVSVVHLFFLADLSMEFAPGFRIVGVEARRFRIECRNSDQIVGDGGHVTSSVVGHARNEIVQLHLNGILSYVALQTIGKSIGERQDRS
jgi:hypothetical protein